MKKLKYVLKRFSKPSQQNILDYVHCKPYLKFSFIQIAKTRKITLSNPICEENPLSCITCTCPDFRDAAFCLHSFRAFAESPWPFVFRRFYRELYNSPEK